MTGRPVLVFSRDPGGANAIVAVLELIHRYLDEVRLPENQDLRKFIREICHERDYGDFRIYGKDFATPVLRRAGFDPVPWGPANEDLPVWMKEGGFGAVITDLCDVDDRTAHGLWRAAARAGIPSYAFLDFPSNLVLRFRGADGEETVPERVFVYETEIRDEMIREGFNGEDVGVVGNLHFQRLGRMSERIPRERIDQLRTRWLGDSRGKVVLFASENVRELTGVLGKPKNYDEFQVLERLLGMVEKGWKLGQDVFDPETTVVVIRPHPKETPGKFDSYVGRSPVSLVVENASDHIEAILAADVVTGMTSMMLLEAEFLGKKVASFYENHKLYIG